jgi:hypothetical protein
MDRFIRTGADLLADDANYFSAALYHRHPAGQKFNAP